MNDGEPGDERSRANLLFLEQQQRIHQRTDRWFAGLLVFEFVVGIAAAVWISPHTWIGTVSQTHIHVWAAVLLGGGITSFPVFLACFRPGHALTRHAIAVAQMLTASLLIHLCGGRIETHFMIFGSLAFLAFYRDWRVLASATVVVAVDHYFRGIYWPQSVFGVLTAGPWRWMEHAGWVVFENVFLIRSCIQSEREMRGIAERQACLEVSNEHIEQEVLRRTDELAQANTLLKTEIHERTKVEVDLAKEAMKARMVHQATIMAAEIESFEVALRVCVEIVCRNTGWPVGHIYLPSDDRSKLVPSDIWYMDDDDDGNFNAFREVTKETDFAMGIGLPGRIWESEAPAWITNVQNDANFPRAKACSNIGVQAAFGFPIKVGGEVVAILEFFARDEMLPDTHLFEAVGTVGEQVGRVLERRRAQERIARNEHELNDFFENAAIGLHLVGSDGTIIRANSRELNMLGYTSEEYVGRNISDFHADPDVIEDILERLKAGETLRDYEAPLRCKDGSIKHVRIDSNVYWETGTFTHTRCFTRDITDERRAVQQLQNSEARSRAILETAADAIITIDARGRIQSFNPAAEKMFGYSAEEIRGENVNHLMPAPFHDEHDGYLKQYLTTGMKKVIGVGREVIGKRRDGTTLPIELSVSEIEQDNQRMFTGIVRDISERKQAEVQLLEANAAAEAANQAKSEFLANMSHELRTPLNAIIGFSEGLLERTHKHPLNDHQKDRLTKIHQSGGYLLGLINDILDLAKVESGKRDVHLTEFELEPLANEVATVAEGLLRSRQNLDFHIQMVEAMPLVTSDRNMVKQILINLVSNAIKFTESGFIGIHFLAEQDRVIISVEDTGLGIPEADLPRVFNKFHQVDQEFRPSQAGTGLGLSICRSFAEILGGTLNVRSVQGEGSTFALSLPMGSTPPTAIRYAELVQEVRDRCQSLPDSLERLRVLCIEDNPDSMLVITDMLVEAGFSVIPAFDGTEGLTLAREQRPDVITLDVMLPGLDGWEVLRRLKADPLVCEIPVIVATAIDETGFGLNLGAADYVVKPIRKQTLLGVMHRLSEGKVRQCLDIAIVDDDPNIRDIISEVLTEAKFSVSCYESGDAFLQALPNHRPDAVVLDLMMPGTDGFGVLETLNQDLEFADIPVVVMTAQTLSSQELMNLNRHVRSVIEKNGLSRKRALGDLLQQLKTLQLETVER